MRQRPTPDAGANLCPHPPASMHWTACPFVEARKPTVPAQTRTRSSALHRGTCRSTTASIGPFGSSRMSCGRTATTTAREPPPAVSSTPGAGTPRHRMGRVERSGRRTHRKPTRPGTRTSPAATAAVNDAGDRRTSSVAANWITLPRSRTTTRWASADRIHTDRSSPSPSSPRSPRCSTPISARIVARTCSSSIGEGLVEQQHPRHRAPSTWRSARAATRPPRAERDRARGALRCAGA